VEKSGSLLAPKKYSLGRGVPPPVPPNKPSVPPKSGTLTAKIHAAKLEQQITWTINWQHNKNPCKKWWWTDGKDSRLQPPVLSPSSHPSSIRTYSRHPVKLPDDFKEPQQKCKCLRQNLENGLDWALPHSHLNPIVITYYNSFIPDLMEDLAREGMFTMLLNDLCAVPLITLILQFCSSGLLSTFKCSFSSRHFGRLLGILWLISTRRTSFVTFVAARLTDLDIRHIDTTYGL